MKKEVTNVPKDKCSLDVLAELKEKTKDSWIFLHRNVVEKLISTADNQNWRINSGFLELTWNATAKFPETLVWIEYDISKEWLEVYRIDADDIEFKIPAEDPENIFFLKMEE